MADVSAILSAGDLPTVPSPAETIGKWVQLRNSMIQGDLAKQYISNAQVQQQQQQQTLANNRASALGGWAYGMSLLPEAQLTPDFVRSHINEAVQAGITSPQQAEVMRGNVTDDMTGAQLKALTARVGSQNLPPNTQQQMATPERFNFNNGQQTQFYQVQRPGTATGYPANVPTPLMAPQGMQPPPEWQQNYAPGSTQPQTVPSPSLGAPQPTGQAPGAIGGTGGYRPAGALPASPQQAGGASPQSRPGGFNSPSPPIGTSETVLANQTAYQRDVADIPDAQNRIRDLQKAMEALQAVNQAASFGMGTGAGTSAWQHVLQLATSYGFAPQTSVDAATNYALAKKYLLSYASRLPAVASNQGQLNAIEANANTDIPNPAALDVTATNIARERFKIAQGMTYGRLDANGGILPPDKATETAGVDYLKHARDFAVNFDRRAFEFDYENQTPDKLNRMLKGMTDKERTKYTRSLGLAKELGLINIGQPAAASAAAPTRTPAPLVIPPQPNTPNTVQPSYND